MKKAFLSLALCLTSLPAMAHDTKPNDSVGVHYTLMDDDGLFEKVNKTYFKPWKQIKVDKASINALDFVISKIKTKTGGNPKFRIVFISIVDDGLSRVLLLSDKGDAFAVEMIDRKACGVTIGGNGLMLASTECVD